MNATPTPELERQLAERSEQLQRATARLIEQEKLAALGGLVAGITHEINTPIGIAVTAASGMEEFARSLARKLEAEKVSRGELLALAAQLGSAATLVNSNLARAAALIGNFKTLAVDQASEAELRLDISDYLRGIIKAHQPVLRGAQTLVELEAPAHLHATLSAGMFSQIISNLIVNALTHAFEGRPAEGGERRIRIELRSEAQRLQLRFADNGCGASAEVRAQLFEPFFTTRRGSGGSGLGLHIVQTLCQRMGGSICLDEGPGPGLAFLIDLPHRT